MHARWHLLLLVPLSSLAGLARPMVELNNPDIPADVWAANLWGDLAFVAGTLGAGLATMAVAARAGPGGGLRRLAGAVALAFLLHWAAYAVSWTLAGNQIWQDDGDFLGVSWDSFPEAWWFTLAWGWPGLLAATVASAAMAWRTREPAPQAAAPAP